MHSYMAVNGYLQEVDKNATKVKNQLQELTTNVGGWDQAVSDAQARRDELDQQEITPSETPALIKGNSSYFGSEPAAIALRNRLQAVQPPNGLKRNDSSASLRSEASSVPHLPSPGIPVPQTSKPHTLVDHPDKAISSLAAELSELEAELTSTGQNHIRWPANLTWANYIDYQLLPTLVYELEYPRTDRCDISFGQMFVAHIYRRIRPFYVLEKTIATFGTFFLLYQYTEHYIMPHVPKPGQSFWHSLLDLALPFMVCGKYATYMIVLTAP